MKIGVGVTLTILSLAAAGCGDVNYLTERYQAERMYWMAEREEITARLSSERPDSLKLLALYEAYRAVGRAVRIPELTKQGERSTKLRKDVMRVIGTSELQAGSLALEANRFDLAMDTADRVDAMAEGDTLLQRRADYFRVRSLRQFRRSDEAIALMEEMLKRYEPILARNSESEDPLLSYSEAIVELRGMMGDQKQVERALSEASAYYRGQLARNWPPSLEARLLWRLVRVEVSQEDWGSALRELERLEALAEGTPTLGDLEPEIRYSEAKIHAMRSKAGDPADAVEYLDRVTKDFPGSPFAARAAFEAGSLLERSGRKQEAVDHYRIASTQVSGDREVAPWAFYRRALLEEQLGDWERSKNLLLSIPLLYPDTEPAVEAPMAVARRYQRVGQHAAAENAFEKAIGTYQTLLTRDTTSIYAVAYRWGMAQAQIALNRRSEALRTIDEMARYDPSHPLTAEGLLRGARIAEVLGEKARAVDYLERFLAANRDSPEADEARRDLKRLR